MGPFSEPSGPSGEPFGSLWGPLGSLLAAFGNLLGALWSPLGRVLGFQGADTRSRACFGTLKWSKRGPKFNRKSQPLRLPFFDDLLLSSLSLLCLVVSFACFDLPCLILSCLLWQLARHAFYLENYQVKRICNFCLGLLLVLSTIKSKV